MARLVRSGVLRRGAAAARFATSAGTAKEEDKKTFSRLLEEEAESGLVGKTMTVGGECLEEEAAARLDEALEALTDGLQGDKDYLQVKDVQENIKCNLIIYFIWKSQ